MKHSYTSLSLFLKCPSRYKAQYIDKRVPRTSSPALERGIAMHDRLEKALVAKDATPPYWVDDKLWGNLLRLPVNVEGKVETPRLTGKIDWFVQQGSYVLVGDWKGLPLDTPIPTPTGWTTMGGLSVGDQVLDKDGKPCTVTNKSQAKQVQCFRILFDDTTEVVADAEHRWVLIDGTEVATVGLKKNDCIPTTKPLELPDVELPIHPYVLGAWLGDGRNRGGEICKPDQEFWDALAEFWPGKVGEDTNKVGTRCRASTLHGLTKALRPLGVLNNKHIPLQYLRASYEQRLWLLRGLMDTDGGANPARHQAVFTTCSKQLSDDVVELLHALGQRPLQSKTKQTGFGLTVTAWPVSFRPNNIQPFSLSRKACRIDPAWGPGYSWRRRVVSVDAVPAQVTQCITVDSPSSTYLCTKAFVPTHNSGKSQADPLQADFYATLLRESRGADEVEAVFVYVDQKKISPIMRPAKDAGDTIHQLVDRVEHETKWFTKPGFYCTGCPLQDCRYHKPSRW